MNTDSVELDEESKMLLDEEDNRVINEQLDEPIHSKQNIYDLFNAKIKENNYIKEKNYFFEILEDTISDCYDELTEYLYLDSDTDIESLKKKINDYEDTDTEDNDDLDNDPDMKECLEYIKELKTIIKLAKKYSDKYVKEYSKEYYNIIENIMKKTTESNIDKACEYSTKVSIIYHNKLSDIIRASIEVIIYNFKNVVGESHCYDRHSFSFYTNKLKEIEELVNLL